MIKCFSCARMFQPKKINNGNQEKKYILIPYPQKNEVINDVYITAEDVKKFFVFYY